MADDLGCAGVPRRGLGGVLFDSAGGTVGMYLSTGVGCAGMGCGGMGALTMDEEWMKTHPQVTRLWESTGTTTVSNPKYRVNGVLESIDNEMVVWLDYSGKVIKFTAKKPEPKTTQ